MKVDVYDKSLEEDCKEVTRILKDVEERKKFKNRVKSFVVGHLGLVLLSSLIIFYITVMAVLVLPFYNPFWYKTTAGTVRYGFDNVNPFEQATTNYVTVVDVKEGWVLLEYGNGRRAIRKGSIPYCYPYYVKGTGEPAFWEKAYWVK
jgi:hypothetical protein